MTSGPTWRLRSRLPVPGGGGFGLDAVPARGSGGMTGHGGTTGQNPGFRSGSAARELLRGGIVQRRQAAGGPTIVYYPVSFSQVRPVHRCASSHRWTGRGLSPVGGTGPAEGDGSEQRPRGFRFAVWARRAVHPRCAWSPRLRWRNWAAVRFGWVGGSVCRQSDGCAEPVAALPGERFPRARRVAGSHVAVLGSRAGGVTA